jgi:signal transduction protein with GAF and PtsI domain
MGSSLGAVESASHAEILHRISRIVSSGSSVDEILGQVIGLAVQATACDACLVYLLDKSSGELILRASQVPHAKDLGLLRLRTGEGVTGWVVENRSVVALPANASADPRFKKFEGLVEDTYQALLSVPMVSRGQAVGAINMHHKEPHRHGPEEIATASFIGEQLGVALATSLLEEEKARLEGRAEEMKEELETRKLMERAKGILQLQQGVSEEEAYLRLRNQSRRHRRPMKDLAQAIILAEDLKRQA